MTTQTQAKTPEQLEADRQQQMSFDDAFDEMGQTPEEREDAATARAAVKPAAVTPAPEDKVTEAAADDVWTGLNEKQRQEVATLQTQAAQLNTGWANDRNRITQLNRALEEARARPGGEQVVQALQSPAAWKELEENYPDIAKPVKSALDTVVQQVRSEFSAQVQPLMQQAQQLREERKNEFLTNQFGALDAKHSDWRQVRETKGFKDWLGQQPNGVRVLMDSMYAEDAIFLLDQFKGFKSAAADEATVADVRKTREQRVQQAATAAGKKQAALTGRGEIPDDFDAAWDEFERRDAVAR